VVKATGVVEQQEPPSKLAPVYNIVSVIPAIVTALFGNKDIPDLFETFYA